jgi:hypothetical protein
MGVERRISKTLIFGALLVDPLAPAKQAAPPERQPFVGRQLVRACPVNEFFQTWSYKTLLL